MFSSTRLIELFLQISHCVNSISKVMNYFHQQFLSACLNDKISPGCATQASDDARVPVRASYVNLYKWPESDAEFVKSVIVGENNARKFGPSPRIVDSYSCRQMYLRSYSFSRKETVPEKTRKCFGKVKERASDFSFIAQRRKRGGDGASCDGGSVKSSRGNSSKGNKKKRKKGCSTVRRLREVTYTAISSIFRRLLSCTTTIDVADDSRWPS